MLCFGYQLLSDTHIIHKGRGAENAGLENAGPANAGLENAGPENARLENDELRLKQPQTRSTSELSQHCVGLLHEQTLKQTIKKNIII